MKTKIGYRVLIVFMALVVIVATLAFVALSIGFIPWTYAVAAVNSLFDGLGGRIIAGAVGLLLFMGGMFVLAIALSGDNSGRAPASVVIGMTENGVTTVSLSAIESMVQRHCRSNGQIRDCAVTIRCGEASISLGIRLSVLFDTNIPQLTAELRESLKTYIEAGSGVTISDIAIAITAIQPRPITKGEPLK